ncbi:MAG: Fe-S cluster assembly scaffold SufA [Pseudomonadota bacterium]
MTAHSKLKMISLTDAAATRIHQIMAKSEDSIIGLRIGVKNGGCAGMEYTMDYISKENTSDDVVEDKGIKLFIDPKAILFLLGCEMDYKTEKLSSGFVFNNPNQTSACGCGESVELTAASKEDLAKYMQTSSN